MARQTNADGRIQANMLMTRLYAKNFIINPEQINVDGVHYRSQQTLAMIEEALLLSKHPQSHQALEGLRDELNDYIMNFERMVAKHASHKDLVDNIP